MPVITDIKPQRKDNGLFNLYVDGKYVFSINQERIDFYNLHSGTSITNRQLSIIEEDSSYNKALALSMNYLATRSRSTKEVRDYLVTRKGFDLQLAERVISRLSELNYLNDSDFADMWIENRMKLNYKSDKEITQELIKKGIDRDTIGASMDKISHEDKIATLTHLINKKYSQLKYRDMQKLQHYLQTKGYRYNDIKQCLENSGLFD